MEIAKVIQENRKKKGYTQEQLANLVGVSAPAVSKWESGASLPDLPLIVPLARALNVTANELLGFTETLNDEKVNTLEQECTGIFIRDGYDAGKARCEALLLEYPNYAYLQFRTAALYQRFLINLPQERLPQEFERIYTLMQQVYDSGNSRLHGAAAMSLASYALMDNDTARAESLLSELPHTETDPDELYPLLYLQKGDRAHAVRLLEQRVHNSAMAAVRALQQLSTIAVQDGEENRALACAEASAGVVKALKLQDISSCMQYLNLLNRCGTKENASQAAVDYLNRLTAVDYDYSGHPFLCHLEPTSKPEQLKSVKKTLLKGFENTEEYAALRDVPEVKQALDHLRETLK